MTRRSVDGASTEGLKCIGQACLFDALAKVGLCRRVRLDMKLREGLDSR